MVTSPFVSNKFMLQLQIKKYKRHYTSLDSFVQCSFLKRFYFKVTQRQTDTLVPSDVLVHGFFLQRLNL